MSVLLLLPNYVLWAVPFWQEKNLVYQYFSNAPRYHTHLPEGFGYLVCGFLYCESITEMHY
jgi:hypothetical protein